MHYDLRTPRLEVRTLYGSRVSDLRITDRVTIPAADLSWSASRSSGPGGQNVNKVASKVDLRFDLEDTFALGVAVKARLRRVAKNSVDKAGRIIVTSQVTRDQSRNLEDAREKLAVLIRGALTPRKRRKKTRPSRRQKQRRLDDKKKMAQKKQGRKPIDY